MEEFTVDPGVVDTASFIDATGADPEECINSIIVSTKIAGERTDSMVLVPATHRLDNRGLKQALGGKTSFVPMERALEMTGMARDSIGPVGAPEGLPVVADLSELAGDRFYVGGGVLGRKYLLDRAELAALVTRDVRGIYVPA